MWGPLQSLKISIRSFYDTISTPIYDVAHLALKLHRDYKVADKLQEKAAASKKNALKGAAQTLNPIAIPNIMLQKKNLRFIFSYLLSTNLKVISQSMILYGSRNLLYRTNLLEEDGALDYALSTAMHLWLVRLSLDTFIRTQVSQVCIGSEMKKSVDLNQYIPASALTLAELDKGKSLNVRLLKSMYQSPVYYIALRGLLAQTNLPPILQTLLTAHLSGLALIEIPLANAGLTVEDRYKYIAERPAYVLTVGSLHVALHSLANFGFRYIGVDNGYLSFALASINYALGTVMIHSNISKVAPEPLSFDIYYVPRFITKASLSKTIKKVKEMLKNGKRNPYFEQFLAYVQTEAGQKKLQYLVSSDFTSIENFRKSIPGQQLLVTFRSELIEGIEQLRKAQQLYKSPTGILIKGVMRRFTSLEDYLGQYFPKVMVIYLLQLLHVHYFTRNRTQYMIDSTLKARTDDFHLMDINWQAIQAFCLDFLNKLSNLRQHAPFISGNSTLLLRWQAKTQQKTSETASHAKPPALIINELLDDSDDVEVDKAVAYEPVVRQRETRADTQICSLDPTLDLFGDTPKIVQPSASGLIRRRPLLQ